ncbi:unnamed protein product [Spirodela intermedia]|uniref:Uncharacterized protein n=1 Tax=Spirodela intermedia TaxID=51605 RepID=A0A7I8IKL6_SPIIN|nr:unnamed protein product [Spirodela intermedia]CAA6658409.1 unnamed protein product [Spirodela intermedia]
MDTGGRVFTVDPLERNAAKGHGLITCMASGNDVIVLGTSKGWVIRHDFAVGDSLATVLSHGGAETYYMHAKWGRPRILSRLKGIVVNAVAWNRQNITEASTKDIILGTDTGQLFELAVDEKDKKEKYLKLLFELKELPEAIMGLQMETITLGNVTRHYVMAVTPTRLYSFSGMGSLDAVYTNYADRAVHFMELPGEIPNSCAFCLAFWAGIYHGDLNFGAQHSSTNGDENFVENKGLLEYSKLNGSGEAIKPTSLSLSEFHFLLLIGDKVKVVNRVSQKIIEELKFDHSPESASKGIIGLCSDAAAGLFYAYDENSIFQVSVNDEGQDMWQVYLEMKEYVTALANCRNSLQRDQVYLLQAESAFAVKDYFRAASFYSKINYILSFEEISLKFISIGEQDALRTFLLRRLDSLSRDDKCQITMISTWVTELYLDKINRLLLEEDTDEVSSAPSENWSSECQTIVTEFRAFLSDCKDVLDEATTLNLLESYGRIDELVYFAALKEKYEIVVHHYIQQRETKKALEVLKDPTSQLIFRYYKFASDLIMLDAYETVESWMITKNLNPRKNETHEVIKYLEFCVHRLHDEDPGVHNLLLSLYAKQEDDSALLRFLQHKFGKGRSNGSEFFYDPKYALRLCLKERRMRACVHIYSMMSMHEEAVALALQVDPELAMAEADKVEDDEDLRKKLWLMVAKHVIKQEKGVKRENIRKAIAFLKETDGLLKIEDILPFFPDFALIDDFKEAICTSLEDYNKQIEQLKEEMNDATCGADNIRSDINALVQRYAVIDRDEECGVADVKFWDGWGSKDVPRLLVNWANGSFYIFPCGHAFHAECLIAHVAQHTSRAQAEFILELQKQLSLISGSSRVEPSGLTEDGSIAGLRSQLDDAIASECPFCGDLMIREISLPFVLHEEAEYAASWEIRPPPPSNQRILPMIM